MKDFLTKQLINIAKGPLPLMTFWMLAVLTGAFSVIDKYPLWILICLITTGCLFGVSYQQYLDGQNKLLDMYRDTFTLQKEYIKTLEEINQDQKTLIEKYNSLTEELTTYKDLENNVSA